MPKVGDVLKFKSNGDIAIFLGDDRVWHYGSNKQIAAGLTYDVIGHEPTVPALLEVVDQIRDQFMLTTSFFSTVFEMFEKMTLDDVGKLDYASRASVCELLKENQHYQHIRQMLKLDGLSQMEEACQTTPKS